MKILVFELACMGGNFESSVLYEGFEMLSMAANGFKRAGHDVTVILDSGLNIEEKFEAKNINALKTQNFNLSPNNLTEIIKIINSKNIDCVFPIAPDPDLFEIVREIRLQDIKVIAPENKALEIASDKWKTYKVFKRAEINTPKTRLFNSKPINYPFIVKPRSGVACENLFKINNRNEFEKFKVFLKNLKINHKNLNDDFLIQEFIAGDNVSVTLFSDGKNAVPVSLNKQNLKLSAEGSKYLGGAAPYEHPLKEEAFGLAKRAVKSIGGLKGAAGVDLILSNKPFVIEINPRVTTSTAALEKLGFNVSESALLAYSGKLSEISEYKFKNIIEFSHIFRDGKSLGIEFKKL